MNTKFTAVDLFCGAGGVSQGMVSSDKVKIMVAVNHSIEAITAHKKNNPDILHLTEDITDVDRILPSLPTKVNILWASTECTNFSLAKGGQSRDADSRSLPECLPDYVRHCDPDFFIVENVKEFMSWGPLVPKRKNGRIQYDKQKRPIMYPDKRYRGILFNKWVDSIKELGYTYEHRMLNSADYGAYTSRTRYFGMFAKEGCNISFPLASHAKNPGNGEKQWNACKEKIDLKNEGQSVFGREFNENIKQHLRRPLAPKTMARIAYGLMKYHLKDFIAKAFNSKHPASSADEPLPGVQVKDGRTHVQVIRSHHIDKAYGDRGRKKPNHVVGSTDDPLATIKTVPGLSVVTCKGYYISKQQYGDDQVSSVDEPLKAIVTRTRQQLVTCETCYYIVKQQGQLPGNKPTNAVSSVEEPLHTILPHNRHEIVQAESRHFINKKQGNKYNVASMNRPLYTIVTKENGSIVTCKGHFLAQPFHNSYWNVGSVDNPMGAIITKDQKCIITLDSIQFISKKNSGKHQVHSIEEPLHTITTSSTDKAVITIDLSNETDKAIYEEKRAFFEEFFPDYDADLLCFIVSDIKMRYLTSGELADITGFEEGTYLGKSETIRKKHIGNAVPPVIAKVMMEELFRVNPALALAA
ncbi:MAG: DNA cytosine methyltransferase [Nitrospinaceae bacterium]|nr:DNA cytosine methyltransferase [Nitrospinaceae bacterium]